MKRFLLLTIILFSANYISAQTFGLKTGLTLSNFSGVNNLNNPESKAGIIFGITSEYGEESIKFNPELIFNQKGSKNDIQLNSIDLNLKGKFYFNDEISFNFGPSVGYIINGKSNSPDDNGLEQWNIIEEWQSWNRIDYSVAFGFSYKLNDLLSFEYSYALGISSLLKDENLKNSSSNLSVNYIFQY